MTFTSPWWLLVAIPAVLVVVTVGRRGRRNVSVRQHRIAIWFRVFGVLLIVIALAQPLVVRSSSRTSVLFLLDRSSSVSADAAAAQDAFVTAAVASSSAGDATAVAVFGADLRLDAALAARPSFDEVHTVIDSSGSDIEAALRGAAAVLPTEGSRRIILLTDAAETAGDARTAARELSDAGIAVDVVRLEAGRAADALVTRVDAPTAAREGDVIPIRVDIQSSIAGEGVVRIGAGDAALELAVALEAGSNRLSAEVPAIGSGAMRIQVEVDTDFDRVPENDTAQVLVKLLGPPHVAVVEGTVDDGEDLQRALESGGMTVDRLRAVPGADELLLYDAAVLVNMPNPGDAAAADLASFVEDLGRGLVVVGGDSAYGLGGYEASALEELLPVASDPDDLIRRQPVAEVLVIDTSGSMADCHCGGGEHDISQQGGVNKTDISRAGAGLAISALQTTDRVGVLAFTSGTRWALPLGEKPAAGVVAEALNSLVPAGDTEISPALQQALEALRDAPEEIRHIVLFTDGWGDDPGLLQAAQDIAAEGITLSVLGTGEGSGESLRRTAALGGGRFYPGRDLASIPEVFVEETLRVARPLVAEGAFIPAVGAVSQVTTGLTTAPPLRGYVLTRPKDTAQVALELGPGDPLLASWQRGLGRVSAWTSDATTRWAVDWTGWEGYAGFWGRVIGDVLPPGLDTPPEVRLDGGFLEIGFDAPVPLDVTAVAHVRSEDGSVSVIPLQRSSEARFEGRAPVAAEGAYWVAVQVQDSTGTLASGSSGAIAGYPDEFAFRTPDPALVGDLTGLTGGRLDPLPDGAYARAPAIGSAEIEMWPWLAAAALVLFLSDVALRRLAVGRGDFEVWRERLRPARRRRVEPLETPLDAETGEPGSERGGREMLPEEETLGRLLRRKRT
ncbi:MAG: VWA domain-containing protein [Acidimicrobiia bacterium]